MLQLSPNTHKERQRLFNIIAVATGVAGVVCALLAEGRVAATLNIQALVPVLLLAVCPVLGLVGMGSAAKGHNDSLFVANVFVFLAVFWIIMLEALWLL